MRDGEGVLLPLLLSCSLCRPLVCMAVFDGRTLTVEVPSTYRKQIQVKVPLKGTSMCTLFEQTTSSNTHHSHTCSDFARNISATSYCITFPTLNKICEMQNAQELNSRPNIFCIKQSYSRRLYNLKS